MSRSYSIEVCSDEFVSQIDLMSDDVDNYNSNEDVYEPEISDTSTSSASINDITTSFSTAVLHLRVTEETLEEARKFLNVITVSVH